MDHRRKRGQQLLVNAAKTAIAHHQHLVSGACRVGNLRPRADRDRPRRRLVVERGECLCDIPAEIGRVTEDLIGVGQAGWQRCSS
jgi:hypothetical protein